ncbi:hypothetical protein B0H14DRAFT_3781015 [Mycena olivaceomarginata]|nr:hypothetical protein B0H14DRAFT_3781015 [Mycena olivaceomarginata]
MVSPPTPHAVPASHKRRVLFMCATHAHLVACSHRHFVGILALIATDSIFGASILAVAQESVRSSQSVYRFCHRYPSVDLLARSPVHWVLINASAECTAAETTSPTRRTAASPGPLGLAAPPTNGAILDTPHAIRRRWVHLAPAADPTRSTYSRARAMPVIAPSLVPPPSLPCTIPPFPLNLSLFPSLAPLHLLSLASSPSIALQRANAPINDGALTSAFLALLVPTGAVRRVRCRATPAARPQVQVQRPLQTRSAHARFTFSRPLHVTASLAPSLPSHPPSPLSLSLPTRLGQHAPSASLVPLHLLLILYHRTPASLTLFPSPPPLSRPPSRPGVTDAHRGR